MRQKYQRDAAHRGSGETDGPSPQQSESNPRGDGTADSPINGTTGQGAELDTRRARLAAHVRTAERLERRAWCALPAHPSPGDARLGPGVVDPQRAQPG